MEEKKEMSLCELISKIHETTGTSPEWELMYILKKGASELSKRWKNEWADEFLKREKNGYEVSENEKTYKMYYDEYSSLAILFKNVELEKINLD